MRLRGYQEERIGFVWPSITSWVKVFLIYYGVLFTFETVLVLSKNEGLFRQIQGHLVLVPAEAWQDPLQAYRLGTYLLWPQFDIINFLVNLLALFFIGGFLESSIGSKSFLRLFFLSGVFASVGYFLLAGSEGRGPLTGPSAPCLGLLAGAAVLYPRLEVIFLIFPMPMWAVAGLVSLIEAYSLLGSQIAWAHLLGLAGGALYAWNLRSVVPLWQRLWPRRLVEKWRQARARRANRAAEDERREMDRILEKIGREGIGSLTSSERRSLDRSSRRLRKA